MARFRSPKLEQLVSELQQNQERLQIACQDAWIAFLGEFAEMYDEVHDTALRVATLDCLLSLADVSKEPGYCAPVFTSHNESCMRISQGRHPMVCDT